jgi:hypothetical protein
MSAEARDVTRIDRCVEPAVLRPMRTDWPTAALRCLAHGRCGASGAAMRGSRRDPVAPPRERSREGLAVVI